MKSRTLFCIILSLYLVSCDNFDVVNRFDELNFGKSEYVKGWRLFGLKPQNPLLTDTIYFDYDNMDDSEPIVFELVKNNGEKADNADFYIISSDTLLCENNRFSVTPPTECVIIGVRFKDNKKVEKGWHGWTLRVVEAGDAEQIVFPEGTVFISDNSSPDILRLKAAFTSHFNTPRMVTDCILSVLLVALLTWILILKFIIFDRFKMKKMILEDSNSEHKIYLRGAISITLTSRSQRQNFMERVFVGKRLFFRDDFFSDGDIIVIPRSRKEVRLKSPVSSGYSVIRYTLSQNDENPMIITNSDDKKIELYIV